MSEAGQYQEQKDKDNVNEKDSFLFSRQGSDKKECENHDRESWEIEGNVMFG